MHQIASEFCLWRWMFNERAAEGWDVILCSGPLWPWKMRKLNEILSEWRIIVWEEVLQTFQNENIYAPRCLRNDSTLQIHTRCPCQHDFACFYFTLTKKLEKIKSDWTFGWSDKDMLRYIITQQIPPEEVIMQLRRRHHDSDLLWRIPFQFFESHHFHSSLINSTDCCFVNWNIFSHCFIQIFSSKLFEK